MTERTVILSTNLKPSTYQEITMVVERQRSIPWCKTHSSQLWNDMPKQGRICQHRHILQLQGFTGVADCEWGVAWETMSLSGEVEDE